MMRNAIYFTLEGLSILKIFKYLSCLFCGVEKWIDWKNNVNFKIYNVTIWSMKQLQYTYCPILQRVK